MSKWAREEYMLLAQPTELSLWKAVRWKQSFAFKLCSSSFSFSESSEKCDLSGAGKGSGEARGTGKIGTIVDFKIRTLLDFRQELFVGLQAAPISGPPLQLVGIVIFRFSQEFLLMELLVLALIISSLFWNCLPDWRLECPICLWNVKWSSSWSGRCMCMLYVSYKNTLSSCLLYVYDIKVVLRSKVPFWFGR